MNRTKILIHVSGGVVQGIYTNDPSIDATLFDVDDLRETHTLVEIDSKFDAAIIGLNELPFDRIQ